MQVLSDFLKHFIEADKEEWILEALNNDDVTDFVIYLNTEEQLYSRGVDSEGAQLSPPYTPLTVEIKKEKGQRFDHVTLKDTGQFYESFKVTAIKSGDLVIEADAQKEDNNLIDKYGEDVLGLTEESLDRFREMVYEELINVIWKEIQAIMP